MSGYLVDTSAHMRRFRDAAVTEAFDHLDPHRVRYRCPVIEFEVMGSAPSRVFQEMRSAFRGAYVPLEVSGEVVDRAARVQELLAERSQHLGIGGADLLIAACAEVNDVTVLHYDQDFETIATVTGQDHEWIVEKGAVS